MQRRMQRKDERGAVLVLAAVGLVMAMIFAGMAVDLGFIAQRARQDQKVADLVALDAVRMLPGTVDQTAAGSVTVAAKASATRNSFAYGSTGYSLVVEWGPSKTGPFTSNTANLGAATAVRITATSPHKNMLPFLSGPANVVRKAVATKKDIAGFTLGSSLLTINTSSSALLNPIVGGMLHGTVNLSLLSWQGLAAGKVTLSALQTQLAALGLSVGTPTQLLNTNLTLAQFYQATANALTLNGDTANAAIFNLLKVQALTAATFKLGDMITVEQGAESSAANAQLNLLQLVTGSAELANGSSLVSVPNVGITVPNAGSVALSLSVIEGAKTYIGTAGTGPHVTTGQLALTITPTVNLINLLGLLKVAGTFPVEVHAAGATGTLKSVACPSKNIVVTVDPTAFSGSVKTSTLEVTTLLGIHVLDVNQTNSISVPVDAPAQDVPFTYSTDFDPPNTVSKHVASPVGLQTANVVNGSTSNINLLGIPIGLNAGSILNGVLGALDTMVGDLDTLVVTPLLKALGMDIGGADVTALGIDPVTGIGLPQCGLPALAG
jgi:uncharacterized membrane protein